MTDTYLQVWLATESHASHTTVVPFVKSIGPLRVHYNITLIRKGSSGSSLIRQDGNVELSPGEATALATLSTNSQVPDSCELSITLQENGHMLGQYRFDCRE